MTRPHNMVVLASEQLMPNLAGLLCEHAEWGPVQRLYIYHTSDEGRSHLPARRLKALAKELKPGLEVVLASALPDDAQNESGPAAVRHRIEAWIHERPADEPWTINATGGLKTMFAGALDFKQRSGARVIYREISGHWYRLGADDKGAVTTQRIPLETRILHQALAHVGIHRLAALQAGSRVTLGELQPVDVRKLMDEAAARDWNWSGPKARKKAGLRFEQWFAALVNLFCPDDLGINLKVISQEERLTVMEADVIALSRGRILLFDLKLVGPQQEKASLAEQITNAAQQARLFGGLDAKAVLVRPGYTAHASTQELAKRLRVTLWTQPAMPDLVENLSQIMNTGPTRDARASQLVAALSERLHDLGECGAVISHYRGTFKMLEKPPRGILHLINVLDADMADRSLRWAGATTDSQTVYRVAETDRGALSFWVQKYGKTEGLSMWVQDGCLWIETTTPQGPHPLKDVIATDPTKPLFPLPQFS